MNVNSTIDVDSRPKNRVQKVAFQNYRSTSRVQAIHSQTSESLVLSRSMTKVALKFRFKSMSTSPDQRL